MTKVEGEANAILTFRDENGQEWVAAAIVGSLLSVNDEVLPFAELKDRAFTLHRFTVVIKD